MATLREIAEEAGVSVETVSRVLNGKRKERWPAMIERAERIRAIATRLNYRPNAAARAMRARRTGQVGVLVRNDRDDPLTHPMIFEAIVGLNHGLEDAGVVLSLVRMGDVRRGLNPLDDDAPATPNARRVSASRALRENMLDGLVIMCEIPEDVVEHVEELVPRCVWVESGPWRPEGCLRRDEVRSGRLCVEHLVALGYREVVFLDHPGPTAVRPDGSKAAKLPTGYSGPERRQGVFETAERLGVPARRFLLGYDDPLTIAGAPALFDSLRPDVGVVASQAYQARWFGHAANGRGLTCPRDFGLCCCDDGEDLAKMWPGLSRVSFDRYALGRKAAELMMATIDHPKKPPRSHVVAGDWITGETAVNRSARSDVTGSPRGEPRPGTARAAARPTISLKEEQR